MSTEAEILDEAVAAFHSGLPSRVSTADDLDPAIRKHFTDNGAAATLSADPELEKASRRAATAKLKRAGRYAFAMADSDGEEVSGRYFEAGLAASNTFLDPTSLC